MEIMRNGLTYKSYKLVYQVNCIPNEGADDISSRTGNSKLQAFVLVNYCNNCLIYNIFQKKVGEKKRRTHNKSKSSRDVLRMVTKSILITAHPLLQIPLLRLLAVLRMAANVEQLSNNIRIITVQFCHEMPHDLLQSAGCHQCNFIHYQFNVHIQVAQSFFFHLQMYSAKIQVLPHTRLIAAGKVATDPNSIQFVPSEMKAALRHASAHFREIIFNRTHSCK